MNTYPNTQQINDIKHIKRVLVAIGRCHNAINKHSKVLTEQLNTQNSTISTARWQVMSAIFATDKPTISKVARGLKSTRQNISVLVEAMAKENIVSLHHNPDHKRAKLLQLTEQGKKLFNEVSTQRDMWCVDINIDVTDNDLQTARKVLLKLAHRLESNT